MANRREMYDLTDQTLTTTDRREKRVTCPENEELASFMWKKRQEFVESKKLSERIDLTLYKAYSNVCSAKSPIATAKDFLEIKGVGKWVVRLMKDFFKQNDSGGGASDPEDLPQIGKKKTRRYLPQKSSASYALLITLHRGTTNGKDFMRKQELIDATEASGLARVPIAPELGKGRPGHSGSKSDWYSGWSGMTKLITKGLVVKSSNPAKYMLTQEGREAANECISRSGLVDSVGPGPSGMVERSISEVLDDSDLEIGCTHLADEGTRQFVGLSSRRKSFGVPNGVQSVDLSSRRKSIDVPNGVIEKFTYMGYSLEQIRNAFAKVPPDTRSKDDSSLLPAILHHLQKDQVDALLSECRQAIGIKSLATSNISDAKNIDSKISCEVAEDGPDCSSSAGSMQSSFTLKGCSSSDYAVHKSLNHDGLDAKAKAFMMPPLRFGERFKDAYDVILILDNREQFTRNKGSRSRKLVEHICSEFKIQLEVRCLPVGDGIWIARHKDLGTEYVLDFIVERKEVDDLRCSIRDNRYRDQKLRLLRCGLQKLIFLVEGDPNSSEAAESIKTACFTTEILEGFDVQRTSGLGDTLRKYGYLTSAITNCYRESDFSHSITNVRICPSFDEFIRKCQDLEKMTVGDIFAIQLMQVSQVTEDVALAVLDMYPTLISLAHAYAHLEGDTCAQEEMLKKQSNNFISGVASKNIFQIVWGGSRIANV